jgi:antitoxin HigA-1
MTKKLPAVHPGEVLREESLVPMKLFPYAVARVVGVPRTRIERLVNEQTAVSAAARQSIWHDAGVLDELAGALRH